MVYYEVNHALCFMYGTGQQKSMRLHGSRGRRRRTIEKARSYDIISSLTPPHQTRQFLCPYFMRKRNIAKFRDDV